VPLHLTIVEPRERLAEGVAYSTPDSEHLLNVPAAGMSAYVEDALHFVNWAECSPQDFIPRHRYADYLRSELQRLTHVNPHVALQHVRDSAHAISTSPLRVSTVGGHDVLADVVVLALGNAAPFKPDWYSHLTAPVVLDDPWVPGALETIPGQSQVLCVGTGLTFVDVALSLTRRGCRVTGVSRHGFLPHIHAAQSTLPLVPTEFDSPTAVSRWLRSQSDWQAALTALRPHTQVIWQSFSAPQQASFLRHARRYWDVHRHRMSQNVSDKLRLAIPYCVVTHNVLPRSRLGMQSSCVPDPTMPLSSTRLHFVRWRVKDTFASDHMARESTRFRTRVAFEIGMELRHSTSTPLVRCAKARCGNARRYPRFAPRPNDLHHVS
jgi:uncharacterized NAD(P)/FAD-binding protein YdhS